MWRGNELPCYTRRACSLVPPKTSLVKGAPPMCRSPEADQFQWRLSNGLWALFIGFGTVLTALKVQSARSWRFFNAPTRGFLADYGVTLAVVVWSCLSYALQGGPEGIPRRLALPNTWEVKSTWKVAGVCSLTFHSCRHTLTSLGGSIRSNFAWSAMEHSGNVYLASYLPDQ